MIIISGIATPIIAAVPDSLAQVWDSTISWVPLIKMLVMLVFVIGLIWASLSLLRRAMGIRTGSLSGVEFVGGVPLGPKRSLQFVRVGKVLYLIGATDHHLGLIAKIDDPEIIDGILSQQSGKRPEPFASILGRFVRRPAQSRDT